MFRFACEPRTLDLELKACCRTQDRDIEESWKRLGFVIEVSAVAQQEFVAKSQSSMRNAKLAMETAAWQVFINELKTDQVHHRTQMSLAAVEQSKKKATLVNTLESYHTTSWQVVSAWCDVVNPTWAILTRELNSQLPAKLVPFLEQAGQSECWQTLPDCFCLTKPSACICLPTHLVADVFAS